MVGASSRKKLWYDYDESTGSHKYEEYDDPNVVRAARFRDGLVNEHDLYEEFTRDLNYGLWAEEFKRQSDIVFEYAQAKQNAEETAKGNNDDGKDSSNHLCSDLKHSVTIDDEDKGLPGGRCNMSLTLPFSKLATQLNLCEGQQSQQFLRAKIFALLREEIEKLPAFWSKTHAKPSTQSRWLHSMFLVLMTLRERKDYLELKIYGTEDFEPFQDVSKRVKQALSHMTKDNF
eukprot:CAMPEP_0175028100 /NCGR_PEP_ID=MMETSP0005-20121125/18787_1 /TAXON_ID=420556 /ORGANISM="Ochromonas sp., Strain CCMP1393" /LENGTH=230 /DNA_ID=CAMNT_0016287631 /DNA_START=1 /DNA_END=690 /DNA_ORIENTATION=+